MEEWIGYIGTLGIGAFLTVLIQEIFKFRLHKRQWSDEIKKTVILKKLQVSEDAMACLQSIIDELMQLKLICQVEKDIPDNYLERCQNLKDHMNTLYPEVQAKLNRLGTYYDLSPIEKRHDIYHAMESFNKHVAELSIYSQHVLISEGTTSKPIRIITGKTGNIKTMAQLIEDLNAIIDYAEDVQTVIRKDIVKYCK